MRVVVDTNVLISCVSPPILDEYQRVGRELARRHPELGASLAPLLALLTTHATLVDAPPLAAPVSADPADEMFLAAARAAGAGLIVSGDRHLLAGSGWCGITVLKPRQFAPEQPGTWVTDLSGKHG